MAGRIFALKFEEPLVVFLQLFFFSGEPDFKVPDFALRIGQHLIVDDHSCLEV